MICPTCGHDNVQGSRFCSDCQAFLEWDGNAGAVPDEPPPRLPEPREGPASAAAGRPAADGRAGTGRAADAPSPAAVTGEPAAPAPPQAAAARRPDERAAVQDPAGADEPAPPSTGGPRAPDRRCPRCRAANAPERRLCGSCGALLDPEPRAPAPPRSPAPAVRPPWWRRPARRRERVVEAGYRPAPRVRRRPRAVWPAVALVLAGAAWFARGELTGLATLVHDRSAKPAPLHPDTWGASSQAAGHPARMAFDGFSNRYWAPASPGTGVGQYVEAGFHHAVQLETLLITPGCSVDDGQFLTQARPSRITVTLFAADGRATRRTISLDDKAGGQSFPIRARTTRVRLTADASYGAGGGRRLAVAEVELFGRR